MGLLLTAVFNLTTIFLFVALIYNWTWVFQRHGIDVMDYLHQLSQSKAANDFVNKIKQQVKQLETLLKNLLSDIHRYISEPHLILRNLALLNPAQAGQVERPRTGGSSQAGTVPISQTAPILSPQQQQPLSRVEPSKERSSSQARPTITLQPARRSRIYEDRSWQCPHPAEHCCKIADQFASLEYATKDYQSCKQDMFDLYWKQCELATQSRAQVKELTARCNTEVAGLRERERQLTAEYSQRLAHLQGQLRATKEQLATSEDRLADSEAERATNERRLAASDEKYWLTLDNLEECKATQEETQAQCAKVVERQKREFVIRWRRNNTALARLTVALKWTCSSRRKLRTRKLQRAITVYRRNLAQTRAIQQEAMRWNARKILDGMYD
ncbi:hypothetical protein QQS21_009037 [Conoideocrella luteorostrata]|uniref:Uncharacterized protein n=1 Tax=Conoideocrella luteorostrata TaxID=1105319 RepID=A0AAJ0CKG1_9HYPO|nr:hypothetical protein QQS21_009037 [Conoideocrella luteorostrata]